MITRAPFLLSLTALLLTACAVAMGSGGPPGGPRSVDATAAPLACALVAQASGGGTQLEARLTAREGLRASYDLVVRGPGVSIDQGGELALAAGETARLGEARVSSALSDLDAELSVTSGGRTYRCPIQEPGSPTPGAEGSPP